MKLSFKTVTDFARSPRGKQLLRQARQLDTPENRKKVTGMLNRKKGGPRPPAA